MWNHQEAVRNLAIMAVIAIATAIITVELKRIADQIRNENSEKRLVQEAIKKSCNGKGGTLLTDALGENVCVRLEIIED